MGAALGDPPEGKSSKPGRCNPVAADERAEAAISEIWLAKYRELWGELSYCGGVTNGAERLTPEWSIPSAP